MNTTNTQQGVRVHEILMAITNADDCAKGGNIPTYTELQQKLIELSVAILHNSDLPQRHELRTLADKAEALVCKTLP